MFWVEKRPNQAKLAFCVPRSQPLTCGHRNRAKRGFSGGAGGIQGQAGLKFRKCGAWQRQTVVSGWVG